MSFKYSQSFHSREHELVISLYAHSVNYDKVLTKWMQSPEYKLFIIAGLVAQ